MVFAMEQASRERWQAHFAAWLPVLVSAVPVARQLAVELVQHQ